MAVKTIFVLCASALLIQTISAQCLGRATEVIEVANIGYGNGCGWAGNGLAAAELGSLAGLGYNTGLAGAGLAGGFGYGAGYGLAGNGLGAGYGAGCGWAGNGLAAAELAIGNNGGALPISSASPIAPTGLYVTSENLIEGPLIVSGQLPFLSAVALEGQVPSGGVAGVSYGCGNGNIGIVSEGLAAAELAGGLGYGAGLAGAGIVGGFGYGAGLAGGLGYGAGLANTGLVGGCGCGRAFY